MLRPRKLLVTTGFPYYQLGGALFLFCGMLSILCRPYLQWNKRLHRGAALSFSAGNFSVAQRHSKKLHLNIQAHRCFCYFVDSRGSKTISTIDSYLLILCRHATLLLQILKKAQAFIPSGSWIQTVFSSGSNNNNYDKFCMIFHTLQRNCHHLPFNCIVGWSIKMFWVICWLDRTFGKCWF